MEIDDPCDDVEAGTRAKVSEWPENTHGEGTEIEMMLTKGDSYQSEEGQGHRVSHYRKVQSSHENSKKYQVIAEGLWLISLLHSNLKH